MLGGLLLSCPSGHGLVTVLGTWLDRLSARSPSSLPGQARAWDAPPGGSALGLGPSHWEAGHPPDWLARARTLRDSLFTAKCVPGSRQECKLGGQGHITGTERPAGARRTFLSCSGDSRAQSGGRGGRRVNSRARPSGLGAQARLWPL